MADSLGVTGSVPNAVGLALSLSEAMSASVGFTMNSVVFPVTTPPKPATTPASARSTTPPSQSKSSAASPAPPPSYPQLRTAGKPFFAVEEILTDVTGSAPDVIGAVLGLSEALRAGKGFVFNSCVFTIATEEQTSTAAPAQPASAASQRPLAPQSSSAATPQRPTGTTHQAGPTFLEVSSGSVGEGGPSSVVRLGLRQVTGPDRVMGIAELKHLDEEFDAGGDSVAVELSVPEVAPEPRTALLAIKGFANPRKRRAP